MILVSKPTDDLEAARAVVEAIEGSEANDQRRIFRWVAEKISLPEPFQVAEALHPTPPVEHAPHHPLVLTGAKAAAPHSQDIKSFVAAKSPRSDVQFAAALA